MLTPQDLSAIGQLIDTKLDQKFDEKLAPIHKDIKALRQVTKRLDSDLQMVLGNLDEREIKLRKRVDRLEIHAGII